MDVRITWEYGNRTGFLGALTEPSGVTSSSLVAPREPDGGVKMLLGSAHLLGAGRRWRSRRRRSSCGRWQGYVEAVLLELLPLQTALALMHGFVMLLLLVAPMALAVFGDLLLYAAPCPRFIGGHLRAPGRGLCLNAAHGSNPPLFPWNSSFISSAF